MAESIPFNVSYTQQDDGNPGSITLNDDTITASGRLDNIGGFVSAGGFSPVGDFTSITVECVRTSKKTMQIRILFLKDEGNTYYYGGELEKVIDDVKIDFD